MRILIALTTVLAVMQSPAQAPSTRFDLREMLDEAAKDGVSSEELDVISKQAFDLAREALPRGRFLGLIGFVGELCNAGPFVHVRKVRAEALELLVQKDSDTMRWSSLVTTRFIPAFGRIPRDEWSRELAEYDCVLDELHERAASDRVRAELRYAKSLSRLFINRRWDWLTDKERGKAIQILKTLESRFGTLTVPGAGKPSLETIGDRARQHYHELENLYFGAQAPPTSGVDLEGHPLDISDYQGKILILDFWTTFCQPCLALVPGIRKLMDELADEPVVYIGVNGDPDRLAGLATAKRVGMTWRNLWDGPNGPSGPAATTWNVPALGWPSVFVIDPKGRIRYKLRGKGDTEDHLKMAIRTLLKEPG